MRLVLAGIVLVIVATFFHEQIAYIFSLSTAMEDKLIFLGLFLGGMAGCLGIVIAAIGFMLNTSLERDTSLVPTIVILLTALILFFLLMYSSFNGEKPQRLHPGETITI